MKKYKNGLVLGKFYGLHLGHLYLIDTAIENCELVNIIVCSNDNQYIPGNIRVNAIKSIFAHNKNVIIHHMDDGGLPQHDYECESLDDFYNLWIPKIKEIVSDLDVVFTSEDYGEDFARYLNVKHFLVDKERKKYPISGTKIRSNPFDNWNFIPKEIKPFFVKRISILGPESVGKTVLTERLSNHFHTNFIEEYGRTVWNEKNGNLTLDDFLKISKGRQELEDDKIKESNKILFADTEDIVTYLFSEIYYPGSFHKIKEFFDQKINTNPYDLYILLSPDCEAIQDGTRNYLDIRQEHFFKIESELKKRNFNYVVIGGSWENRFRESVNYIISETNL